MFKANPRAPPSRRARGAESQGSGPRADGPSANFWVRTESAVREIIMRVADLLLVLNNGSDAGGALAVLSL